MANPTPEQLNMLLKLAKAHRKESVRTRAFDVLRGRSYAYGTLPPNLITHRRRPGEIRRIPIKDGYEYIIVD